MQFWKHLITKLEKGKLVYLLTVIDNSGSSPGRKGFKMMVCEDGFIFGSIGGGVMEYRLVELAKEMLKKQDLQILVKKQIHRGDKEYGSGMICSGEQTVVFHPLAYKDLEIFKKVLDTIRNNSGGTLVLKEDSINFVDNSIKNRFESSIESERFFMYKENIGHSNTMYIVGGGHVSVAVSEIFAKLGFHVVVLDNREELNTLRMNAYAHERYVVDYMEILEYIQDGPTSYISIMTNKFIDDKIALSKVIRGNYAYIGVLGSRAKLKKMWEVLKKDGFTEDELAKIHGPIGIPIKSQTPKEIAVSIAAEVIQIKNKNYK